MLYIEADDINDCDSLPEAVDGNDLGETGIERFLHIFAEISELPPTANKCCMHESIVWSRPHASYN